MGVTVTNGISWMRQALQDTDTVLQGATDTEYLRRINDRYLTWFRNREKRPKEGQLCSSIAANAYVTTSSSTEADEILSVQLVISTDRVTVLERMEWNELRNLQNYDNTAGTPLRYAITKSSADNKWRVATHPIPDVATYVLNAVYTVSPAALTASDTPILVDAECYWLYRAAAADLAGSELGRPDLVEGLLAPIPEDVQAKMGLEQKRQDPKRRDPTAVV